MYIVYISVNITAEQSLSPVSPIGSPLTNPDNPLDTSHVSSTYQNRKSRGLWGGVLDITLFDKSCQ